MRMEKVPPVITPSNPLQHPCDGANEGASAPIETPQHEPHPARVVAERGLTNAPSAAPDLPARLPEHLAEILELLREHTGANLANYRHPMLLRRISGRMRICGHADPHAYLRHLRQDRGEADRLLEYITIKVSGFFRTPALFELLQREVLPELAAERPGEPLRIWSAGCGHGEEAYSLAITLLEAEAAGIISGGIVHATDVDQRALASAAAGRYSPDALGQVSQERRERFFDEVNGPKGQLLQVKPQLRDRVIFSRHDVSGGAAPTEGAPDLIACRNVLIYLGRENAEAVQLSLMSQLAPGGFLCLGESEWLAPRVRTSFQVVDRSARVFRLKSPALARTSI